MGARAPSDYDFSYDESDVVTGETIITTVPSVVVDNQQFILDHESLVLTDCFWHPVTSLSVGGAYKTIARYYVHHDLCGVTASSNVVAAFYCYAAVGTSFTVALEYRNVSGGPLTQALAVASPAATPTWRGFTTPIAMKTDGEEEIWVKIKRDAGAGNPVVNGFAIYRTKL